MPGRKSLPVVAYDDEPESEPASPLVAAFVDPFISVSIDERGNVLRSVPEVVRNLEPPPPDATLVTPINTGAGYHNEISIGEPMIEPERPERGAPTTFEGWRALMRRKVQGRDGQPLSGGGGSSIPKKPIKIRATRYDHPDHEEADRAPRYRVVGLTIGERDFYARRPSEAERVLHELVRRIINDDDFEEPRRAGPRLPFAFAIFGLIDPEITILRTYPVAARLALVEYARKTDASRITMIDRR